MAAAISVENLGKSYRVTHESKRANYRTLRESLSDLVAARFRRRNAENGAASTEEFWALKDVSFEIQPGEVFGIIGRNGAGKSTLLKILSRITKPTTGAVTLNGRIGSLLEVGTGFHPELTGRENIYLNGSILGMRRSEISAHFDEIVDFAEVEQFLDTPVKRYSSGMYTRLAFAVAAYLEPEILVVDEVLAVGDAAFQKKCLGKMGEVASQGRTVLFVSHNMEAISTLTHRCLLLSHGQRVSEGPTSDVLADYLRQQASADRIYTAPPVGNKPKITRVEVNTSEPAGVQVNGKSIDITIEISTPVRIRGACVSFQILDSLQRPILHLWTFDSERPMCREPGVHQLHCSIPKLRLYMGQYSLKVYFSEPPGGNVFEVLEGICPFEVAMYGRPREFEWRRGTCTYLEDADWHIEQS